jgi:hypothetical protein
MLVIGVIAAPGPAQHLAEQVARGLPRALADRFPGSQWRADVSEAGPWDAGAPSAELVDSVRRRLLAAGWDLAVGLTDLPLHVGRRPVSAHASPTHGVGLVSLPALGAVHRERRLKLAVLRLVDGLLGEAAPPRDGGRRERMTRRLQELGSPLGSARVRDDGTIRFTRATLRGNLRLLVGMVRDNEPSKLIVRLSRVLVAAVGTAAFALAQSDVWTLADHMGWTRVLALAAGSVVAISVTLVIAHGLWEHAYVRAARERVVLFNLATAITVGLGVLTLHLALFLATLAAAGALIPESQLVDALGHGIGFADYVRLAVLVGALATVGGALGSLVESDIAVRDATYRAHEDERTEAGDHQASAERAGGGSLT